MTELLTAAQMRTIEEAEIESGRVTGLELMERAGQAVVDAIFEEWPEYRDTPQRAVVLCGPGNNGGDGFVIARLLAARGWPIMVLAPEASDRTPADAAHNRRRWEERGAVLPLTRAGLKQAGEAALYIDAVFGTGLTRPPEGEIADLLSYLAGSGGDGGYFRPRLVAVDVPSGLCADSGRVLGCAAPQPVSSCAPFARLTVTFETPKPGHFLAHGPDLCGKLVVCSIGLTEARSRTADGALRLICLSLVPPLAEGPEEPHAWFRPQLWPKRQGHKYTHGHVTVLTGGMGRTGAARLAARGALRIGAGLVSLAAPGSAMMEVACQITALMLTRADDAGAVSALLEDPRRDVVCLGPGLGLDANAAARLEAVLSAAPPPPGDRTYLGQGRRLVLDADALTLLARRADPFAGLGPHTVLTPHWGEFKRLFSDIAADLAGPQPPDLAIHADPETIMHNMKKADAYRHALSAQTGPAFSRVDAARAAAKRSGAVVLLKGRDTVVADPNGQAFVHAAAYGRSAPWLASAGAGDVLAGFIAGLMAQGQMPAHAAILAARCHVDCALRIGPGLIAEDLPEVLPAILADLTA